jgi:hypothetical protein
VRPRGLVGTDLLEKILSTSQGILAGGGQGQCSTLHLQAQESITENNPVAQAAIKNLALSQALVAHACNPSYLGG